jgi:hypothetical protein
VLLLARAAAGAGRTDEALRLEQRLSESVEPGTYEGAAAYARLWTTVRLARMRLESRDDEAMLAMIRQRERSSGSLRDPPALLLALTWDHPDDWPQLFLRNPSADDDDDFERVPIQGGVFGLEAVPLRELEDGTYLIEVRREDRDALRDTETRLLVITMLGTDDEQIHDQPLTLTRERRTVRFSLSPSGDLTEVPVPRERG